MKIVNETEQDGITQPTSTAPAQPNPAVHTITTKLPAFSILSASAWFRGAEIQLCLRENNFIIDESRLCMWSDSWNLFPQISSWLNGQGDQISYKDLKVFLLWQFML